MAKEELLINEEDPGTSGSQRLLQLSFALNRDPLQSLTDVQKLINKFLVEETASKVSFLLPVRHDSQDQDSSDEDLDPSILCSLSQGILEELPGVYIVEEEEEICFQRQLHLPFKTLKRPLSLNDLSSTQIQALRNSLQLQSLESCLAVPIHSEVDKDKTLWIACLLNKYNAEDYGARDLRMIQNCFKVALGILETKRIYEHERRLKTQCQSLLAVARKLFTHLDDVSVLLRQIMDEARSLTQAEKCSLFLVDNKNQELVAKVFDGDIPPSQNKIENTAKELRIPLTEGIAGHVALSGEILNIRDAQSHPLFYNGVDRNTGFITKNILCFPIKDESQVIGVAELCNKNPGAYFSQGDEEIANAFSVYCGLSIMHSLMYKKVADAQHRSKLSNELMMYHMKVADEEVYRLAEIESVDPSDTYCNFNCFSFCPRNIKSPDTSSVVLEMFQQCGMIQRWRIPRDTLARFILMVKRGYRDPPYHNWMHAFSVAHFCYLLFQNVGLLEKKYISELEGLALLVACLCHDLDHRGTNNSFQVASNSVLAALYSSEGSVMERHHFAQTMCILNTEGCNILENLNDKDYTLCLDLLRDIILATDLAHHLRIEGDIRQMSLEGYDTTNPKHHSLLTSLLMSSCDIADQTKNWENSKLIAELVYSEFFSQGDLEKAMGNKPVPMMDRERACIPKLQIEFIDGIALPIYELLFSIFPKTKYAFDSVQLNRQCWIRANDALTKRGRNGTGNVRDIFKDAEIEEEVLEALRGVGME